MYNFGVVVDDAQMGISHVLRAQAAPKGQPFGTPGAFDEHTTADPDV